MRTIVVEMKTTRAGHPWAVLEVQWRVSAALEN